MQITKIEYRFGDSSVPPPYHRSYSIVLTRRTIHAVVDSYGDIIGETDGTLTAEDFENAVHALEKYAIRRCKSVRKDHGCSGGTTESVNYWEGDEEAFSASVYHCGGDDYGDLCGNVRAFAAEIKRLIPDLATILSR